MRALTARTTVLVVVALAASCVSLLLLDEDMRAPDQTQFSCMGWNLVLAWIPFALALALIGIVRMGAGTIAIVPVLVAWVLFLPNAPYLATDLVHLTASTGPAVSDVAMFAAFAITGVYLGLVSAWLVRVALLPVWSRQTVAWVVNGSLVLCGIGIYLGRVVQVNSWDIVTAPARVIDGAAAHTDDVRGWLVGVLVAGVSAGVLVAGYHLLARLVESPRHGSPS